MNLPRAQSKGHLEATDAATFNLYELHWWWAETPRFDVAVCRISHREMLSLQAAGVHLYCQCYHWGPGLFLAAFISCLYPAAGLDVLRFVKKITRSQDTSGRTHLNCLIIMDSGYDSLSHPERSSTWGAWAEVQLLYHHCIAVCVIVRVCVSIVSATPYICAQHLLA